jgi:hypothetical protein
VTLALLTLALVGTVALAATMVPGYLVPQPGAIRQHFVWALLATTLLVMAHSFIMFFLIATGVELKDMEKDRGWGDSFRRRTIALKSRVFPIMTGALLMVIANFILGAAAHTRAVPVWVHSILSWSTLAVCVVALYREYRVLGDNNRLIAEAAAKRGKTAAPATAEDTRPAPQP